ncbi:uncharacterized protein RNJ42_02047 [Nakaseomyces bracarensis]|uniref:uncharacterized protein n=1 Tax=Nakaseomyces bracarensis TaxID=273131 RepID=UPI003871BDDA
MPLCVCVWCSLLFFMFKFGNTLIIGILSIKLFHQIKKIWKFFLFFFFSSKKFFFS